MMITILIIGEGKGKQRETLKGECPIQNDNEKQNQTEPTPQTQRMELNERIRDRIMDQAIAQEGTRHNNMDEVFIEMWTEPMVASSNREGI